MTLTVHQVHVDRFREILVARLGLRFDDGRLDQVIDVLRDRAEATGCRNVEAYLGRLAGTTQAAEELRVLAETLTVVETFFFRNADNFRAFTERMLPDRVRARRQERRLRILSAGCASGDEPYSIAIQLQESLPNLASWDVQIIAIDLNRAMLAKASRARYSAWSLRATPDDLRRRHFREDGREFVLSPTIQEMVTFDERNLVDDDPTFWSDASYDIIFCRNVIMYFPPEVMERVVQRFANSLVPDGYLILGHAETLRGVSGDFHLCCSHDTFYYQRRSDSSNADDADDHRDAWCDESSVLPIGVEVAAPWVDVIQQASERIAALGTRRSNIGGGDVARVQLGAAAFPHAWDRAPVLDAMRQERFGDALSLLDARPPDVLHDADALLLRAALLTNGGRLEEAEQACASLLAADELNAGAHYLMALCREHAGDAAAAAGHDRTAVYVDATFAMPHLHLGLAARRAGDVVTARRELSLAVTLLGREDTSRLLLFGGGFTRETLLHLCRAELRALDANR